MPESALLNTYNRNHKYSDISLMLHILSMPDMPTSGIKVLNFNGWYHGFHQQVSSPLARTLALWLHRLWMRDTQSVIVHYFGITKWRLSSQANQLFFAFFNSLDQANNRKNIKCPPLCVRSQPVDVSNAEKRYHVMTPTTLTILITATSKKLCQESGNSVRCSSETEMSNLEEKSSSTAPEMTKLYPVLWQATKILSNSFQCRLKQRHL